ncbi:MAG: galactose-1-phosphate uridylyltransferase, partial [Methanoregula sp.]
MFTVTDVATGRGTLQYREEYLTGLRCRISPERLKRHIDQPLSLPGEAAGCPFCRENIFSVTQTFP